MIEVPQTSHIGAVLKSRAAAANSIQGMSPISGNLAIFRTCGLADCRCSLALLQAAIEQCSVHEAVDWQL